MANISTITDLVINQLSQQKYEQLCAAGQLEEYQLYITDDDQAGALSNEIDNLKSNVTTLSTELPSKLISDDIAMSYVNQHIYLSAKNQIVGDIDCADFIKDGMLSTAELCGTTLVMSFNTDADSDPISVELSNFVDNYDSKIETLSDAIDKKIFVSDSISGISGYSDLSVVKLDAQEYSNLLVSNALLSNALYIVQDDYIDAYGQQIKNIALPMDLSDAATKGYVDNVVSSIQIPTDLSSFTNSPGYLLTHQSLSNYYIKNETSSASEINNAFELSSGNKVFIDDRISGIVEQTDLSIVHLSSSEYEQLCANGQILSNALYIVEDSFTNNYGKQIKNVAIPSLSNDAATKGYVDDSISNSLSDFYHKSETSSANEISVALSAKAELSDINAMKSFVENTYKTYDYISAQLSNNGYMTSAQIAEQQYVTFTDVSTMISSTIGNINSILEEINVGNMQIDSMIDQLNGIGA